MLSFEILLVVHFVNPGGSKSVVTTFGGLVGIGFDASIVAY